MLVIQSRPDILFTSANSHMSSKSLKRPSNTTHLHTNLRVKKCRLGHSSGPTPKKAMDLPVIEEDKVSPITVPPPNIFDPMSSEDDSVLSSSHIGSHGSRASSHSSVSMSDVATSGMSSTETEIATSGILESANETEIPANDIGVPAIDTAVPTNGTIVSATDTEKQTNCSTVSTTHAGSSANGTQLPTTDIEVPLANTEGVTTHTIPLSKLEHCMPRAYIRICFAYRTHSPEQRDAAIERLKNFVRRTIDAKPYLAGKVVNSKDPDRSVGQVEISFSEKEFLEYPPLVVKELADPVTREPAVFDDLAEEGFPPSKLRPEEVAILPTDVHEQEQAPIFMVQANTVQGGLIVSLYLHHCISDGKGFDLLATGDIIKDEERFQRHLNAGIYETPTLNQRLRAFAHQKTHTRLALSYPSPNQINTRDIKYKRFDDLPQPKNAPGRGCVICIPHQKIADLKQKMRTETPDEDPTLQNVLMALLWRYMTRARIPSVSQYSNVKTSKLLIPVDIRRKMKKHLADNYFGAAVDSASAEMTLNDLADSGTLELSQIAKRVQAAIKEVDDDYVRQAIGLAMSQDRNIDVRDLQASNMDRVTGADMYITSWLRLRLYQAHMDMDLGPPEWVRKPWSRDPGSCIILPQRCKHPETYEVVVQMTEADMSRLLEDQEFMAFVTRVIDESTVGGQGESGVQIRTKENGNL